LVYKKEEEGKNCIRFEGEISKHFFIPRDFDEESLPYRNDKIPSFDK
jgi:hypothetical protein